MDKKDVLVIMDASPATLFSVTLVNPVDYFEKYADFNCPYDIFMEYLVEHEEYNYTKFVVGGYPKEYVSHVIEEIKKYYPDAEYCM